MNVEQRPGSEAEAESVLESCVAAFEAHHRDTGSARIADFLPPANSPSHNSVLRELIRVDLELAWESGRRATVEQYIEAFPQLQSDRAGLQDLAFEEYRVRRRLGDSVAPADYESRLGVKTADWPRPYEEADLPGGLDKREALERAASWFLDHPPPEPSSGAPRVDSSAAIAVFRELSSADAVSARRLANAVANLPSQPPALAPFEFLEPLGAGAFGRVYLARQGDLAGRLVVVKVTTDLAREAHALAQLQHTNIVPVYSIHRAGKLQALCMPYFGRTTLADVLSAMRRMAEPPVSGSWLSDLLEERATADEPTAQSKFQHMSHVEVVLDLAIQLTEGLVHAHDRGIRHGDIKPANILLTRSGQALLLDFNLAYGTRLRSLAAAAYLGGTLPYMSPLQLAAFRNQRVSDDARADIYALGVVLFELLTGKFPFPLRSGKLDELLDVMLADRFGTIPRLRPLNPAVSPAFESIVRRCLAYDDANAYSSGRQLLEDLRQQREHRPLLHAPEPSLGERMQKWRRRHPRLAPYVLAILACALVLPLSALAFVLDRQHRSAAALNELHAFDRDLSASRFALGTPFPGPDERRVGLELSQRGLDRYGLLDDATWERSKAGVLIASDLPSDQRGQLRRDMAELLFYHARGSLSVATHDKNVDGRSSGIEAARQLNLRAESLLLEDDPLLAALWVQRAHLLALSGDAGEADRLVRQIAELRHQFKPGSHALAALLAAGVDAKSDLPQLRAAEGDDISTIPALRAAVAADPQDAFARFLLGVCLARQGERREALMNFEVSVALWPDSAVSWFRRGMAHFELGQLAEAKIDLAEALRLRPDYTAARVNQALIRQRLDKDLPGAIEDLSKALEDPQVPTRVWLLRARLRAQVGDKQGAAEDHAQGLRLQPDPQDAESWVARGMARAQREPQAALADFDSALIADDRCRDALQDKAYVLGELLGKSVEAVACLDRELEIYPNDVDARAGRGVLFARLGRRDEALKDAAECLRRDTRPLIQYQVAGMYALTSKIQPSDRAEAMRLLTKALEEGFGAQLLESDTDLAPLRGQPEFQQLIEASRKKAGRK